MTFYGNAGMTLSQTGNGYKIYDPQGKEVASGEGPGGDKIHIENFLESIRGKQKPNSEIAEGQKSTLLCHLGNIAYRVGRTLHIDPKTGKIQNDKDAEKLWGREYRRGWEPKV